jgi:hypothetical protein
MKQIMFLVILTWFTAACNPALKDPEEIVPQMVTTQSQSIDELATKTVIAPLLENGRSKAPAIVIDSIPLSNNPQPTMISEFPRELWGLIQADIIQTIGKEPGELKILRASEMVWPDSSLGCPQPGLEAVQVQVEGFQLVLLVDGEMFDYRTSGLNTFFRCQNEIIEHPKDVTPNDSPKSVP